MIESDLKFNVGLYQENGGNLLDSDRCFHLSRDLLEKGYSFSVFYSYKELEMMEKNIFVLLGSFPSGNKSLRSAGRKMHETHLQEINGLNNEEIIDKVEALKKETGAKDLNHWKPWFPVIDYDRCTNCMQCLTFCLFDVYGVSEDKIQVQNEDNCKTNCPACSRVCPEVAILFPKYNKGPINGDIVRKNDIQREAMKVDISALLGGDLYNSLRTRQKDARKRFSTERDESRALLERKKCLGKLMNDLDIPAEVLMSLPSAGDIEERTNRAKAKLAARQAQSQSVKDGKHSSPTEDDWGI